MKLLELLSMVVHDDEVLASDSVPFVSLSLGTRNTGRLSRIFRRSTLFFASADEQV